MDSRTGVEKVCEVKFYNRHFRGLGTRDGAPGGRDFLRLLPGPAPAGPPLVSASPASRRPSRRSRLRTRENARAGPRWRGRPAKPGARSRARRTGLRMRRGRGARAQATRAPRVRVSPCARSVSRLSVPAPFQSSRNRLKCKFPVSSPFSLPPKG